MSRLTLRWHLRGIIEGTTEPQDEVVGYEEVAGKEFPIREQVDDGSYTTGFTQESGRFCDALEVPARKALESGDPVKFLDAVANDPIRRFQERNDASWLLNRHIWPDAPRAGTSLSDLDRDDLDREDWKAWHESGMMRRTDPPMHFPMRCVNSNCNEGECLADPDILRDEGRPVCMLCGTEQPVPEYP